MSVDPFKGKGAKTLGGWHGLTGALATRLPTSLLHARTLNKWTARNLAQSRRK